MEVLYMKKFISILLVVIIPLVFISGCSSNPSLLTENLGTQEDGKLQIVTTIFPIYDWTKEILGDKTDNLELTMLLDNGVDLHSYQPTVDDLVNISTCDIFIYVGDPSDSWVEDALKNATNKDMVVINLLESLGDSVKTEEIIEGMEESDHNHDHDDEHDHEDEHEEESDHEHDHEGEPDEHVWLSLKNAKALSQVIGDKIIQLDPDHKDDYLANISAYMEKLSALDEKYQATVDNTKNKTLLFGDRFPFRYLVDDYGLEYYAAFSGCSAETEASFETISFLSNKVDELNLSSVLTIENTQHKIAETIVANASKKNQQVLTMDSLQSTSFEDSKNGITYLSIMEKNLEVLKEALK